MPRRPFNLLQAAFWLLAFVIGLAMLETLFGLLECAYIAIFVREPGPGCQNVGSTIHEVVMEFLTALLALLLAARNTPPPDE